MYLSVKDLLILNEKPTVSLKSGINEVIIEISEKRLGVTAVTENSRIVGIITDGDLRRMLTKSEDFSKLSAEDIMSKSPKTININAMAIEAMELMESNKISQLVVEDNEQYAGVIHLHDLIKEGII